MKKLMIAVALVCCGCIEAPPEAQTPLSNNQSNKQSNNQTAAPNTNNATSLTNNETPNNSNGSSNNQTNTNNQTATNNQTPTNSNPSFGLALTGPQIDVSAQVTHVPQYFEFQGPELQGFLSPGLVGGLAEIESYYRVQNKVVGFTRWSLGDSEVQIRVEEGGAEITPFDDYLWIWHFSGVAVQPTTGQGVFNVENCDANCRGNHTFIGKALTVSNGTLSMDLPGLPQNWGFDVWVYRVSPADIRTPFITIESRDGERAEVYFLGDDIILSFGIENSTRNITLPCAGGWAYFHFRKSGPVFIGINDQFVSTELMNNFNEEITLTLGNEDAQIHFDELWIYEATPAAIARRAQVYKNQKVAAGATDGDVVSAQVVE